MVTTTQAVTSTLKKLAGLRLAHRAAMVQDAAEVLRTEREAVRAHQRRTHGEDFRGEGGTDDMIHVGDIYNAPPATAPQQPAMEQSSMPWWIKTGIAAALLASGGSLGVGVASYLAGSGTDSDTRYELRLGGESETP